MSDGARLRRPTTTGDGRRATERGRALTGFAVWRSWPDGVHDLIGPCTTPGAAQRRLEADRRFWRRGACRPVEYRVVAIGRRDFDLHRHRHDCRSPDCV